jgi:hypothetical protein
MKKARNKTQELVIAPDAQDFPKYFKNGSRFTRVDSETSFTEVQLMKTATRITIGKNIHVVEDALANDVVSDRTTFEAALKTAMEKFGK